MKGTHKHTIKGIHNIRKSDLRRIHWRKVVTRKVIVIAGFGIVGFVLEHYTHLWFAGRGGELAFGAVIEHLLFGLPVAEG